MAPSKESAGVGPFKMTRYTLYFNRTDTIRQESNWESCFVTNNHYKVATLIIK